MQMVTIIVHNKKQSYNWNYKWDYIPVGDWYLVRAKFTNDWNFFVREVGRGRGVLERSLEVTEVRRGGGRRWRRHEAGLHIFLKKDLESLSRLSSSEFRLATNKMSGYNMPRVKLKMIIYCSFFDLLQLLSLCASDRIVPDWGGINKTVYW